VLKSGQWSVGTGKYSPHPNKWDTKNVKDFKSPWKGKKLYVPRRYQVYHQNVNGFSISGALFLEAIY
jgi:hypothetical protein